MPSGSAAAPTAVYPAALSAVQEIAQATEQPEHPRTRGSHGIQKPKQYTDGTVRHGFIVSSKLNNLDEAFGNSDWKQAMDSEYMALMRNKT